MKILFVGNSAINYYPNGDTSLSAINQLTAMATAAGLTFETTLSYYGAGTMEDMWSATGFNNPQDELRTGAYDVLVVGGGFNSDLINMTPLFKALAEANGTQTALYGIWEGDWEISVSGGNPVGLNYHNQYRSAAIVNDTGYAPNGLAMGEAHKRLSEIYGNGDDGQTAEDLLTSDLIHASELGSYLIANMLYWTILDTAPPPATQVRPAGVSLFDAQLIQSVAADIAASNAIPLDNGNPPEPLPMNVSGRIFEDENGNGVDDDESAGAATRVLMVDLDSVGTDNVRVLSTFSDADGQYSFNDVSPGRYQVRFTSVEDGKTITSVNVGNEASDSDALGIWQNGTVFTGQFTLALGQSVSGLNMGVVSLDTPEPEPENMSVSGRIFEDANRNGINDSELAGQITRVLLVDLDSIGTGNTRVYSTFTDSDGRYEFEDLEAGRYQVRFAETEDGKTLTRANVGTNEAIDSDATGIWQNGTVFSDSFRLAEGDTVTGWNMGVVDETPPEPTSEGRIQGFVFRDSNNDDQYTPQIDDLVSRQTVSLMDENGAVLRSLATGGTGFFRFDDVADGTYQVAFDKPPGTDFVTPDIGPESFSSDVLDFNTGRTDLFSIAGDQIIRLQAGITDFEIA